MSYNSFHKVKSSLIKTCGHGKSVHLIVMEMKALELILGEPPLVLHLESLKNPLTMLCWAEYKRSPLYYKYQMTLHINGWVVKCHHRRQSVYAHLRAFVWTFVAIIRN